MNDEPIKTILRITKLTIELLIQESNLNILRAAKDGIAGRVNLRAGSEF